jgi:hypothetical protein
VKKKTVRKVRKSDQLMQQKINAALGHLSAATWMMESLSDDISKLSMRRKAKGK